VDSPGTESNKSSASRLGVFKGQWETFPTIQSWVWRMGAAFWQELGTGRETAVVWAWPALAEAGPGR
jgi:hypothetical protein